MKIAILALQGAFSEHTDKLQQLGVESMEIRQLADLNQDFDGLILPGGESTVQGKLLRELGLLEPLRQKILNGLPTLGTCAGLILLAENLVNDDKKHLATLPVTVKRNAYGRQLGSFLVEEEVKYLGKIPLTFIRAPYIESTGKDVEILAKISGKIVGVKYQNQIGISFHPEVNNDLSFHRYFVEMCRKISKRKGAIASYFYTF
ncbi:pyridoxal 5'-phosphate synthase glutaminase subunit PdxT [Mannheimia haemolytica]|nr:pyridoxal 5'-phosphate synthase glutaminase subunit PdxT [Mannheimia haemolytica]